MHYYQFNIGDYARSTRHLSNLEDLAYRRLLDLYYDTESPLIADLKKLARLINMRDNVEEVTNVIEDFFTKTDKGYIQCRVAKELAKYVAKADTARVNGSLGGRPKNPDKTQWVSDRNPEETGSKANQEPITNNQETVVKKPLKFIPPTIDEVRAYCQERGNTVNPQKFIDHYEANGWMRGKNKIKSWKACVRTWEDGDPKPKLPYGGLNAI